ncbi:hypothetical protein ACIPSA_40470 [Streptomyces sp. NPDC086549]
MALRMLYVLTHRGVSRRNTDESPQMPTHRESVLDASARTLVIVAPCTG